MNPEPATMNPEPTVSESIARSGIVAGSVTVVLVLVLTVLILVSILLIWRTKVKKTSVTLQQTDLKVLQNDAYGITTDKADISMDCNMAYGTSAHLPSPSQPGATLTQNPAYITTPNIPVKTNQSYGGIATTSLDSDQLYATPRGEGEQVKQDLDHDYI